MVCGNNCSTVDAELGCLSRSRCTIVYILYDLQSQGHTVRAYLPDRSTVMPVVSVILMQAANIQLFLYIASYRLHILVTCAREFEDVLARARVCTSVRVCVPA